ncbi:MAG: DUF460 domain-containing protein [Staphylothermus sp.]|nr:DUF460 domain-containing protein [Staphylothermus sp.]
MNNGKNEKLVMGVDILPGYSPSSSTHQPHYAVVILKGDKVINSFEEVSFARLIRLAWEYKPDILAIDNVFELGENTDKIIKIINLLPPNTRIVQVTGWGDNLSTIKNVAYNMGIDVHGKMDPLKTAYIAALIASKGGGAILKPLEEKTKIIVSRGRSVSHGGMSYDRYKRSIRAGILNVTKEVKRILDRYGFDYDLVFRKSNGGLEQSIFTVYAPREKLYGIIKPFKNKSVRLIVRPVYRNKIMFETNNARVEPRGLIVGVDPGISTGLAILDLSGRPLYLHSSKNLDRGEILNIISKLGIATIVSTDVMHPPELIRKIAAALNAQIYTPPHDLSTDEKQELVNKITKKYPGIEVKDSHVRDALAAAYKAYLSIKDKLIQAEKKVYSMDLGISVENVKISIARGKNIAEALEQELEKLINELDTKIEHTVSVNKETDSDTDKIVNDLSNKMEKLRYENRILRNRIIELQRKLREKDAVIEELKLELKNLKNMNISETEVKRRIYLLEQEIKSLKEQLRRKDEVINKLLEEKRDLEKTIEKLSTNKYIGIPRSKNLSIASVKKIINKAYPYNGLKIIFVDEIMPLSGDVINFLRKEKIAIITYKDYGELYTDLRVPIVSCPDPIIYEDATFIEQVILNKIDVQWNMIEKIEAEEDYQRVIKLVEEYQEERKKKLGVEKLTPFD